MVAAADVFALPDNLLALMDIHASVCGLAVKAATVDGNPGWRVLALSVASEERLYAVRLFAVDAHCRPGLGHGLRFNACLAIQFLCGLQPAVADV